MLGLLRPDTRYEKQYREMMADWQAAKETPAPWVLCEDFGDFAALVQRQNGYAQGIGVPEDYVPSTTLWAYDSDSDKIIGAVNIRHRLNAELIKYCGHVGYGVRPSERQKGYASLMLSLALPECKRLGIKKAMLGCDKTNTASAHTIQKNGGVLENEVVEEGTGLVVQRYWIEIQEQGGSDGIHT